MDVFKRISVYFQLISKERGFILSLGHSASDLGYSGSLFSSPWQILMPREAKRAVILYSPEKSFNHDEIY